MISWKRLADGDVVDDDMAEWDMELQYAQPPSALLSCIPSNFDGTLIQPSLCSVIIEANKRIVANQCDRPLLGEIPLALLKTAEGCAQS